MHDLRWFDIISADTVVIVLVDHSFVSCCIYLVILYSPCDFAI